MSYSEDDVLRPDEWPVAGGSGTWTLRRPQMAHQRSSLGTYATLSKPLPPPKPARIMSDSIARLNLQPHVSRSQHHLNYASVPMAPLTTQQRPGRSRGQYEASELQQRAAGGMYSQMSRRFSEDDSAAFYYLPSNAHSSVVQPSTSSSSSSFKPVNLKSKQEMEQRRKPVPPAKPPRPSLDNNEGLKSRSNLSQSKSQRNLAQSWNKTVEIDPVPPPEGYGNIKRSASNDFEGFLTTFGGYTKGSFSRPIEHENAHQRLLADGYSTDHLYDEIGMNGRPSAAPPNGDLVISTNKIYSVPNRQPAHPPHRETQPHPPTTVQPRSASQRSSNKHLRSRSEHHPRCPNSSNHYEAPLKLRDLSLDRPPHLNPVTRMVTSCDEYAVVQQPPSADSALDAIAPVLKQLKQEYRAIKQMNRRSVGTRVEQHLFATMDSKGKKVSVKAKTLDRIPLLRDMAMLTDPVAEDFFAQPNSFPSLNRSSKILSEDGKKSLRRSKHTPFTNAGTTDRKKKKKTAKIQDQNSLRRHSAGDGSPIVTSTEVYSDTGVGASDTLTDECSSLQTASSCVFGERKDWSEIQDLMELFESVFNSRSPVPNADGQEDADTRPGPQNQVLKQND